MPIEVQYKTIDNRVMVNFTATDNKDLFEQIAAFAEIFENNLICLHCNSNKVRLSVREVDSNKYYERICNDCGYSFKFGQKKKGGSLFPKTSVGWTKYDPNAVDAETHDEPTTDKKGKRK